MRDEAPAWPRSPAGPPGRRSARGLLIEPTPATCRRTIGGSAATAPAVAAACRAASESERPAARVLAPAVAAASPGATVRRTATAGAAEWAATWVGGAGVTDERAPAARSTAASAMIERRSGGAAIGAVAPATSGAIASGSPTPREVRDEAVARDPAATSVERCAVALSDAPGAATFAPVAVTPTELGLPVDGDASVVASTVVDETDDETAGVVGAAALAAAASLVADFDDDAAGAVVSGAVAGADDAAGVTVTAGDGAGVVVG